MNSSKVQRGIFHLNHRFEAQESVFALAVAPGSSAYWPTTNGLVGAETAAVVTTKRRLVLFSGGGVGYPCKDHTLRYLAFINFMSHMSYMSLSTVSGW